MDGLLAYGRGYRRSGTTAHACQSKAALAEAKEKPVAAEMVVKRESGGRSGGAAGVSQSYEVVLLG